MGTSPVSQMTNANVIGSTFHRKSFNEYDPLSSLLFFLSQLLSRVQIHVYINCDECRGEKYLAMPGKGFV
jgi:hypothetical protein